MFGSNKNEAPAGAREKIALAKKMRDDGHFNITETGGGAARYPSQTIPVTVIYFLATAFAMFLTDSTTNLLAGVHLTGLPSFDHFMAGGGIIHFTGNTDEDRLVTILARGAGFFFLAGVVPFVAYIIERFLFSNRVTPLVLCWAITVILLLLHLLIPTNG